MAKEYNVYKKRYSSKGVLLRKGESEKKGAYVFRWRDDLGNIHSMVRKNLKDLREAEMKLTSNRDYKSIDYYATLNSVIEKMFEVKTYKYGTRRSYMCHYKNHIRDNIGKMKVSEIKKSDVMLFYKYLKNEAGLKNGSIKVIHAIVQCAFDFAIDDGLMVINPAKGACDDYPTVPDLKFALTDEESAELVARMSIDDNDNMAVMTEFLLNAGLRISELLGLTWSNVDFEKRTLTVDHQLQVKVGDGKPNTIKYYVKDPILNEASPKNKFSVRTIPLNDTLYKLLVAQKEYTDSIPQPYKDYDIDGYRDFCFIRSKTGYVVGYEKFLKKIRSASLDNEGRDIVLPMVTPHILRHTLITNLCRFGMEPKEIIAITGHSTFNTVLKIYDHVNAERVSQSFDRFDKWKNFG